MVFEYCEVAFCEIIIHTYRNLLNKLNEINYSGISDRLNYVLQIANGVEYLRNQNIVHKDLKTTDLLIKSTLEKIHLKLTKISNDINIPHFPKLSTTLTTSKHFTTLYMAPQTLVGRTAPTVEFDIFAFGIILCRILLPK